MTEPLLVLEHVIKRYGAKLALDDVSMRVAPGEVVGLAGPNGAGKSTIARLAGGFAIVSAGSITAGGVPPSDYRMSSGIGFVAEEPARINGWRVRDLFALRSHEDRAALDAERILELFDLRRLLDQRIATLSKGQLRLACAAYALLGPPRLVILDEPDAGLDPLATERLIEAVAAAGRAGAAVLALSHNLELLERLCSRILFILDGRTRGEHICDGPLGSAREAYRQLARFGVSA